MEELARLRANIGLDPLPKAIPDSERKGMFSKVETRSPVVALLQKFLRRLVT